MTERLKNQVAIVTGAADGMGHAIAELFCKQGAKVCIADINAEKGAAYADELVEQGFDAIFVETDIADSSNVVTMVETVVEKLGSPSVLVNNAALIGGVEDPLTASEELWKRSFAVNVDGMWNCCREVLPYMKENGSGSIINIGSVHSFQVVPKYFPYAVTKHAVIGLTRNLAVEYGEYNIRVNALLPRNGGNPHCFKAWADTPDPEASERQLPMYTLLKETVPLKKWPTLCSFLPSNESSFMTGHSLVVDGGRSILYHD